MSIEALAMAGADYVEHGIDLQDWETTGGPPPHLLVEKISSSEAGKGKYDDKKKMNEERVKAWIQEWAKAVAAKSRAVLLESEYRNNR